VTVIVVGACKAIYKYMVHVREGIAGSFLNGFLFVA